MVPIRPQILWTLVVILVSGNAPGQQISLVTASVVSVNGIVRLNQINLKPGDVVRNGDRITTDSTSSTKLLLPDRTILDIGNQSQVTLQLPEVPTEVNEAQVEWGSVRASIQKQLEKKDRFRIRTKSSVLSARGTEFSVSVQPIENGAKAKEEICVASGDVNWAHSGKNEPLTPGTQVSFSSAVQAGTAASSVQTNTIQTSTLSSNSAQAVMQKYSVADQTFRQSVVASVETNSTGKPSFGRSTLVAVAESADALAKSKRPIGLGTTQSPMDGNRPALWQFDGSAGEKRALQTQVTVILDP